MSATNLAALRRRSPWLLVLVAGPLLGACTTTLYKANQVSVPLLREHHQVKATLAPQNFQVAYAALPGFGLLANGYTESYDKDARHANGWLAEAGAGVFGQLVPNLVWETYGGLGYGALRTDDQKNDGGPTPRAVHYDAQGLRFFVQPNLGYTTPYFEVAGSLRLSGVKHLALNTSGYTDAELTQERLVAAEVTRPLWIFAEPSLTLKVGYKWVKAFLQRTWVHQLGGGDLAHAEQSTSLGISVDIGRWYDDFTW